MFCLLQSFKLLFYLHFDNESGMAKSFLILGSNLGNRLNNLDQARLMISKSMGPISICSAFYETEPWGFADESFFLNQVVVVSTTINPFELLTEIIRIEAFLGRTRGNIRYVSRTIDIDILFYDDLIIETPELIIPHIEMKNRRFVLEPLAEIASDLIHPVLHTSVRNLLNDCTDQSLVHRIV